MKEAVNYYCVGFYWKGTDPENQLPRFQKEGIWENGFEDKYIEQVNNVLVGSKIAAKTSYTRKEKGKTISVLEVHGLGTVKENLKDGKTLKVDWDKNFKPFKLDGRGAYRSTINQVNHEQNIELIFNNKTKKESDALAFNIEDLQDVFPLNQILFGPPGTGKTYNTINKAVSIIDGIKEQALNNYYGSRAALKERFEELVISDWNNPFGQIGFITFHQSMSYEDFIEGIKPETTENKKVVYDILPGIFKNICTIAKDNWLDVNKGTKEKLSFEDAFSKFKEQWEENPDMKFSMRTEGKDFTILEFSKSSIRFKKANGSTGHTLSISTLRDFYYSKKEIKQTGVGIYYPGILKKLNEYQPSIIIEKEEKNFVLIIDEINRGNVSQIFGELITLIEEDKRLGNDEALEVMLPYSKEKFGVPPNLHIIGTMNTADRSVEALDTALRRRFSFTEMPPQPELLAPNYMYWNFLWSNTHRTYLDYEAEEKSLLDFLGATDIIWNKRGKGWDEESKKGKNKEQISYFTESEFKGYNLRTILQTINNRIEVLLNRDNLIGHSYFLKVDSEEALKETFFKNIIPLLQEYFFGDYGKIGLILGEGFIRIKREENSNQVKFAKFSYDDTEGLHKRVYEIIPQEKIDIKTAINQLLNE